MPLHIDHERLITLVECRPILWNIDIEEFREKGKKKAAWVEVCRELVPSYDENSKLEKDVIVNYIQGKWKHIRDSYTRYRRKAAQANSDPSLKKPQRYHYANHLGFLSEIIEQTYSIASLKEEDGSNGYSRFNIKESKSGCKVRNADNNDSCGAAEDTNSIQSDSPKHAIPLGNEINYQEDDNSISLEEIKIESSNSNISFVSCGEPRNFESFKEQHCDNESDVPCSEQTVAHLIDSVRYLKDTLDNDEDFAFFKSLLPLTRKLDRSQKLRFRIEVLQALEKVGLNLVHCKSDSVKFIQGKWNGIKESYIRYRRKYTQAKLDTSLPKPRRYLHARKLRFISKIVEYSHSFVELDEEDDDNDDCYRRKINFSNEDRKVYKDDSRIISSEETNYNQINSPEHSVSSGDEKYDEQEDSSNIEFTSCGESIINDHQLDQTIKSERTNCDDEKLVSLLESAKQLKDSLDDDEDFLFLKSLLPLMKKLDDNQKIRFRIEVLQVLEKVRKTV